MKYRGVQDSQTVVNEMLTSRLFTITGNNAERPCVPLTQFPAIMIISYKTVVKYHSPSTDIDRIH